MSFLHGWFIRPDVLQLQTSGGLLCSNGEYHDRRDADVVIVYYTPTEPDAEVAEPDM
jgi:hypothetical protein